MLFEESLHYPHTNSGDLGRLSAVLISEREEGLPVSREERITLCEQIIQNPSSSLPGWKATACLKAADISEGAQRKAYLEKALVFLSQHWEPGLYCLKHPIWVEQDRVARVILALELAEACYKSGFKNEALRALKVARMGERNLGYRQLVRLGVMETLVGKMPTQKPI